GIVTNETGTGSLVFGTNPLFNTAIRISSGVGNGIGFWSGAPDTYGIYMSNDDSAVYGDVTDYYIANVMSGSASRGFIWTHGTSSPSMALNSSSGNLTIKGDFRVNGGDIILGSTNIFSGGDITSLNN